MLEPYRMRGNSHVRFLDGVALLENFSNFTVYKFVNVR